MHQGIYTAASGALSSLYRQDVAANNLANISTPAFKMDKALIRQRDPVRFEDGLAGLPSNELLEALGAGVMGHRTHTGYGQGSLLSTGNDLDLAIQGDGFFVVLAGTDEAGDTHRLTRDGRFALDPEGRLVTHEGMPVLDEGNDPIKLKSGLPVTIEPNGVIRQGGAKVAQLALISVPDPQSLRKEGASLYAAPADVLDAAPTANASIRQRALEQSAADPISAMMAVSSAGKDAEANISMISRYDQLMDRAINTYARLA